MDSINQRLNEKGLSVPVVVGALVGSYIIYFLGLGIYRGIDDNAVYFSPLARFPGPKLAAFTTLYQAYYDIWLHGQYFKQIDQLHQQYGGIVRINPHELHVNDPSFIDELYAGSAKKRDKYKWAGRSVLLPDSLVATEPNDLHRRRRAALNPYFSKARIRQLDPAVQDSLQHLYKRLDESGEADKVFPISLVYKAATCDIITKFCFGVSTDYMAKDDYQHTYFKAVDHHLHNSWWMTYVSWLGPLMDATPAWIMGWTYPGLKSLWEMHSRWAAQIESIRCSGKLDSNGTVFHGLLNSDLPSPEKANARLRQEAQLLVLAGQDTTAYTLSSVTFELLNNPEMLGKLQAELVKALPESNTPLNSAQLEQLPYLTGIIQEGIRLHPGALVRQTRVATNEDLFFKDSETQNEWIIPTGTPVSMDARSCNLNPKAFADPHMFIPERWIENPRIDRYMLSFSKGTRICLGMNLAYSELYMILGGIFRRYELYDGTGKQTAPTLALHDTYRARDVDVTYDCLVPFPQKGSKGIQIKVRTGAKA
ncbi:MAG: hypothetical protein Q9187_000765 [Circinaria calcarea]